MKILVTGGSGFIGSRLTKKLWTDHYVKSLSRTGNSDYHADVANYESLEKIPEKFDVIYHLAAVGLDDSLPYDEMYKTNVIGTTNLLNLAAKQGTKMIFLSTAGVLGETKKPAKEDYPYNPVTPYERTKYEAELEVKEFSKDENLNSVILRPSFVYGDNDFWLKVLKFAKKGHVIGYGKNLFHATYIQNALQALERSLNYSGVAEVFNLGDENPCTLNEIYLMATKILDIPVRLKHHSSGLIKFATRLGFGKEIGLSPDIIDRITRNKIYDITKAKTELGYKPLDFRTGLEGMINSFRSKGLL